MRCLYIVSHHPISPNSHGGGSAICYEQLAALHALGHEMHLWHYCNPETRKMCDDFVKTHPESDQNVRAWCQSVTETTFPDRAGLIHKLQARVGDWLSGERVENPLFRSVGGRMLRSLIRRTKPDAIWAQHLGPGQIAALQNGVPVIYVHHDWLYKVKAFSEAAPYAHLSQPREERVAMHASAVVSGSWTECEQLRTIGCRNVTYIPISYDAVHWGAQASPSVPARLAHLGGMRTTANRVGLERFFEVVWPALAAPRPELWIVGDLGGASPGLLERLAEATCTGFVSVPATVLRPYDINIIPWEHDTGTRTRLPLVFGHGQVIVAVRPSVAGFPEARDRENCRLVESLADMPAVLDELLRDSAQRERLGRAARATFESSFTRPALLPLYQSVLESAVSFHAARR